MTTTKIRIQIELEVEVDGLLPSETQMAKETAIAALEDMCDNAVLLVHMPDDTGREIRLSAAYAR